MKWKTLNFIFSILLLGSSLGLGYAISTYDFSVTAALLVSSVYLSVVLYVSIKIYQLRDK